MIRDERRQRGTRETDRLWRPVEVLNLRKTETNWRPRGTKETGETVETSGGASYL